MHHPGTGSEFIPAICLEIGSGCKPNPSLGCSQGGRNQETPMLLSRGVSADLENQNSNVFKGRTGRWEGIVKTQAPGARTGLSVRAVQGKSEAAGGQNNSPGAVS